MIENEVIEQIKTSVPITDYLFTKGITPVNSTGRQYLYHSPITNERSPSFFVEPTANVFNDFSSGEKGDIIRLVRLLDKVDFPTAIRTLQRLERFESVPFSLSGSKSYVLKPDAQRLEVVAVKPLQHRALVQYVEKRRIPFDYAYTYVREIHYQNAQNRAFFGIGFQTDKGSWAVRSEGFKTWIGAGDITTISVPGATDYNVFEGFFDFLSALVYFGVYKMRNNAIILNSTSHLNRALETLKAANKVYTFLDNDDTGRAAVKRLRSEGCAVVDRAGLYGSHNDFNAFLCSL
ncbi:DNA primase [Fibrisoma limi BUZ 3]|uniref:DNA primase n=1 Tax=Fibrisoma limi BUZ 3 TaxID=1185876 RepID=I2GEP1_9BACT|nr:CHC2 zinc finger domain-containing protein [Fibrisoma limi]CCH52366.1 DNA primase [Fibrisoma limi BUZ 3]